jgi:hypothetical protein
LFGECDNRHFFCIVGDKLRLISVLGSLYIYVLP